MPNNQAHDTRTTVAEDRVVAAVSLSVAGVASSDELSSIFSDSFESGDKSASTNGFAWTDSVRAGVANTNPLTGSYSLEFNFQPANAEGDAFAEQRFDLGSLYSQVEVEFDLYIPSGNESWTNEAYFHSNSNNKLFRLWGGGYSSFEKIGASLWGQSDGTSKFIIDWNNDGQGTGPKGTHVDNFISASDRGSWINVRMYFKCASSYVEGGPGNGAVKVWRNGVLIIDDKVNNYSEGADHAWQNGYLLGWQNGAQPDGLTLHIDNVSFKGVAA